MEKFGDRKAIRKLERQHEMVKSPKIPGVTKMCNKSGADSTLAVKIDGRRVIRPNVAIKARDELPREGAETANIIRKKFEIRKWWA